MSGAPLPPGSVIGILGGGQLGRMLGVAAARLGFRVHILAPEDDPPAARVASAHTCGDYDDEAALRAFAQGIDVATYEFENVPAGALRVLTDLGIEVRPGAKVLSVCQDRLAEKRFLRQHQIATAPFAAVSDHETCRAALEEVGAPAILKSRRFGYDGKGQAWVSDVADIDAALDACGTDALLEGVVAFDLEVSQISARGADGTIRHYDLPRNDHEDGILRRSAVPAPVPAGVGEETRARVAALMDELGYVGIMTTEFFWSKEGGLVANEIAPRVHNSGHWTPEASFTSQFEQHIRAVAGWPLGDPGRHADAVMENLLGKEAADWHALAQKEGLSLTLYDKGEMRTGRKMGHTVTLSPRRD